VLNQLIGSLARLQIARAYGLSGDTDKARRLQGFPDFLTLWKDADLDIPILKEAKAEYAKLQLQRGDLPTCLKCLHKNYQLTLSGDFAY
jgi:hypothetical protein